MEIAHDPKVGGGLWPRPVLGERKGLPLRRRAWGGGETARSPALRGGKALPIPELGIYTNRGGIPGCFFGFGSVNSAG